MRSSLVLVAVWCVAVCGQDGGKSPPRLEGLSYRFIGPYAGGRTCRSCGVAGDPLTYYTATASGGVWKSSDGGLNWKPIFDDQPTSSIGSIAVAPSDPNVVYVGTGEANIRGNVTPGLGIFVSKDAGQTWSHAWKQIGQIGTMAVHPKNADVAFAAVLGHAFGQNAERGVYRTTDGGTTWQRVLFKSELAGCSDVCIDPNNPRVIFAGFWETVRRPWELVSGGPGSDLYVSRDGGDTWTSLKAAPGMPKGLWGKVGVAVSPADSQRVFAIIENEDGGLFRSDDGGRTWQRTSGDRTLRQRAWYYYTLTPHPTNPEVIYVPNVPLLKSIDGGRNFERVRGCHHGDHHDLWIDPTNPLRMIDSNDGGVDISLDGGKTWHAPPLPITQFYHVSADNRVPYHVMGCMQDLGAAAGPSHSLKYTGITAGDWYEIGGFECGHMIADPSNPDIVYGGSYGGVLTRWDGKTKQVRNVSVQQANPSGIDPEKMVHRFAWVAPVMISAHDPKSVYHCSQFVNRTRDGGQTWERVSDDLTRNDRRKQQWSGGPITGDNTGAEVYCTISAIAESPVKAGVLWVGTDDGLVHVSQDNGKTWTNASGNVPDLPDWGKVACIDPSPHDAGTAWIVVDNHMNDDYRPHAWVTRDFGATWEKISSGLAADVFLRCIREDVKVKDLIFAGTERGVVVSTDAGKTWQRLQLNLPTVPVANLVVKGDDLVVGTHGRSIYILDDLTPVRELGGKPGDAAVQLLPVLPVVKWYLHGEGGAARMPAQRGRNPARGSTIWFHLKDKPEEATLEILDEQGKVIAAAKTVKDKDAAKAKEEDDEEGDDEEPPKRVLSAKQGLNRFVWDFTHDGADVIPNARVDSGNPGQFIPALPGKYTVKLTVGKESASQALEVKPDPRLDPKEFSAEKQALALKVRDDITQLSRTVQRLRALHKQIAFRKELLKDHEEAKQLLADSAVLSKKLSELEEKLHNPKAKITYDIFAYRGGAMLYSQLVFLLGSLTEADGPPTKAQIEFANECHKSLAGLAAEFESIVANEVKQLNAAARKLEVPELYVPKAKKP